MGKIYGEEHQQGIQESHLPVSGEKLKDGGYRGVHVYSIETRLMRSVGYDTIQLVVISRPLAYGEYEPYSLVDTEQEFESAVKNMFAVIDFVKGNLELAEIWKVW